MPSVRFLYNDENREFVLSDVSLSMTVQALKQMVKDKWPSDLKTQPPDASHVRLLFAGQFLSDGAHLKDVPHFAAAETTSVHVLVLPPPSESKAVTSSTAGEKTAQASAGRGGASAGRCQCVIS